MADYTCGRTEGAWSGLAWLCSHGSLLLLSSFSPSPSPCPCPAPSLVLCLCRGPGPFLYPGPIPGHRRTSIWEAFGCAWLATETAVKSGETVLPSYVVCPVSMIYLFVPLCRYSKRWRGASEQQRRLEVAASVKEACVRLFVRPGVREHDARQREIAIASLPLSSHDP